MLGQTLGSYKIVSQIGEGGMGVVYLAEHALIGRKAAIKLLRPECSSSEEMVSRFFNEARATALIKHSGLVDILDFGHHSSGSAYIVMEYLEGEGLGTRLDREGKLAPDVLLQVARQVAAAVGAAHQKGIVHRDLKPDNVFLVNDDINGGVRVKVLDFGIAKLAGDTNGGSVKTRTGSMMGTPLYMSPEQCRGAGTVDARADIYSLGCMLYEMVCGQPPFLGDGPGDVIVGHLTAAAPPLNGLEPSVNPELEALIAKCLAKKAEYRPQTMELVVVELDRLAGGKRKGGIRESANLSPAQASTLRPGTPAMGALAVGALARATPTPDEVAATQAPSARAASDREIAATAAPTPPTRRTGMGQRQATPAPPEIPETLPPDGSFTGPVQAGLIPAGNNLQPVRGTMPGAFVPGMSSDILAPGAATGRMTPEEAAIWQAGPRDASSPSLTMPDAEGPMPATVRRTAVRSTTLGGSLGESMAVTPAGRSRKGVVMVGAGLVVAVAVTLILVLRPKGDDKKATTDNAPPPVTTPAKAPPTPEQPAHLAGATPPTPTKVDPPAAPTTVALSIDSTPPGAEVYRAADGVLLGKTPHTETLTKGSGEAVFILKLDGYEDNKVSVPIGADSQRTVPLTSKPVAVVKPPHETGKKPVKPTKPVAATKPVTGTPATKPVKPAAGTETKDGTLPF